MSKKSSFCIECGQSLPKQAKFCPSCGTKAEQVSLQAVKSKDSKKDKIFNSLQSRIPGPAIFFGKKAIWLGVVFLIALGLFFSYKKGRLNKLTSAFNFCSISESSEQALTSVVKIETELGTGSGFFIDSTHIVTNNHVLEGVKEADVTLKTGKTIKAQVFGWDERADIALLEVNPEDREGASYLKWSKVNPPVASDIVAIGYPLSHEEPLQGAATVTKGTLSAYRDGLFGIKYIQTDTSINPGNSGGPLINECGQVVGVNDLYFKGQDSADPIFYAIVSKSAKKAVSQIMTDPSYSIPQGTLPRFEDKFKAVDVVMAYYDGLTQGSYSDAYQLFTVNRQKKWSPEDWKSLFNDVLSVDVKDIKKISDDPLKVQADLVLFTTDGINKLRKEAKSVWSLKYSLGRLALNDLNVEYGEEKAVYNEDYVEAVRSNKGLAETYYPEILSRDFTIYPQSQVVEVQNLIDDNLEIINRLHEKVTKGEPLSQKDISDNDEFFSNHQRIREINTYFEQIDLQSYYDYYFGT